MNKIERFHAVLRGDPVDRVPAGFWFHFTPEFSGGQAMAQAHLDFYRSTDLDVMKVMNDTGYAPIGRLHVAEPADWLKLEPTPLRDPLFQSHLEGLRRIVEVVGNDVPVMTTAFNPFNQATAILRSTRHGAMDEPEARRVLLAQLRREPEPVLHALGVMADDFGRFFRACVVEAGINGLYYSAQGGDRELMTSEEHARWIKPYDLHVLRQVGEVAEFIVGHFCGPAIDLGRFVDYPVDMANWAHQSANLSLAEGKALLGGIAILGGLDERGPLVYGPREALRREIEAAVAEMGTRGFMLGAGCTVPGDVDLVNLVAAREMVTELTAG